MLSDNEFVQDATKLKSVWLVNHHAHLPSKDGGGARHHSLAQRLPEHGWVATLLVSSTRHPSGTQALRGWRLRKITSEDGVQSLWVRTNAYGRSTALRFVGMAFFCLNLSLPWTVRGLGRPDVVIGSTVHPLAALAGLLLARRFRVPFVYEIRDVWPESLYDLAKIGPSHPVSLILKGVDRLLISRSVLVVSPLPRVNAHLEEQGFSGKPFLWVPNGAEAPSESEVAAGGRRMADKPFTFMYLGAHGRANALDVVLKAFDRLAADLPAGAVALRLVGDGPEKPALERLAASLPSFPHVSFEDRIPRGDVLSRAQEADCLVANLYDHPVFRFGISPNKYFMYMSAGRPVIAGSSAPNSAIKESNAGLAVDGGNVDAYAEAMRAMVEMPQSARDEFAANGLRALHRDYTFDALASKLANGLDSVLK